MCSHCDPVERTQDSESDEGQIMALSFTNSYLNFDPKLPHLKYWGGTYFMGLLGELEIRYIIFPV